MKPFPPVLLCCGQAARSWGVLTLVKEMRPPHLHYSPSCTIFPPFLSRNVRKGWGNSNNPRLVATHNTQEKVNLTTTTPLSSSPPPPRRMSEEKIHQRLPLSNAYENSRSDTSSLDSVEHPSIPALLSQDIVFPQTLLHLSSIRLAPKKKGGAASAQKKGQSGGPSGGASAGKGIGGANHIFNIYKDIPTDHKILEDKDYPPWLFTLDKPEKTYGELAMMFLYGVDIEKATLQEYLRFTRLHTKNLIKLNNMRLKKSKRSSVKPLFWDV
ncbi:mitochondrial ribosomal protein l37 protein [Cystoisospora suis]|uniref:Large ribosomal subunit protein mL54 n=1 Tax=Cystoisospora suis TaxID=483139 RepID=A0A2C6KGQ9_9APIC|nr:mitochondrial ribosomal protein l37 protein [Cystoisospora suis]